MIIGSRSGVGGHRAIIGGLLVAAAAVIVFSAALSAAHRPEATYMVAARALPAGSIIGPGDTTTARLGLSGATAASAFHREASLIGRSVAVGVQPGQLLESSMLAPSGGAALRPVSIPVDADSISALATGQEVDVLSTPMPSSTGSQPTAGLSMVLRGATLLSVGHSGSGVLAGGAGATVVVTLGVGDLAEAEQLVEAAHTGTVELLRGEPGDGTGLGPAGAAGTSTGSGAAPAGPSAGG